MPGWEIMFVSTRDALDGVQVPPPCCVTYSSQPWTYRGRLREPDRTGDLATLTTPELRFQDGFHDPSALARPVLCVVCGHCLPHPHHGPLRSEQTRGAKLATGGPRTRSRAVLSPVGVGHSDPTLPVCLAAPGSSDLGSKPLGRLSPSWSSHGAPLCSGDVSGTQTSCVPRGTGDPLLLL